ncbi:hypothetical protein DOTSEDRAFT_143521 [Dothistroma septosporum NZE10]|uniref:Matrin-type domain-containing protein n=1 Tax=Dothistroma septosporum (strain NZE10 / CBS 128990) TaxID=675120 RepID=N1Q442_DOTSN|nr:hypothetical protein DOTSEDRAFT_143521 [Dothistroma septosporum NZE10]
MSEYWKSTPSYWCKFCSQYVRDTSIERKNHEASAKHQNNIQRSLRELHKNKEHETREKQRAQDEVARLNSMFGAKAGDAKNTPTVTANAASAAKVPRTTAPAMSSAAQRKAHAEQLAALGVELPDGLKQEVTGVGNYQVVNARLIEPAEGRSTLAKGIHKRKADNEDTDIRDEEAAPRRKAWGNNLKKYPGSSAGDHDAGDLDALLSGVKSKLESSKGPSKEKTDEGVKKEDSDDVAKSLQTIPDVEATGGAPLQQSSGASPPAVVFKKRKSKK